ncbi:MAG: LPS export ABC transporter periplasmic protein LptC [Syntrophales bacterium]
MIIPSIFLIKRNIIWLAIAIVALSGGLAFFCLQREAPNYPSKKVSQPAYQTQIDGLRFYELNHGRRVVSITADRFAIGRGKIGFFSTGLTRKAIIQNAIIEIYANSQFAAALPGKPSPQGTPGNISLENHPDFTRLFAEETFSSLLPVRNIAEIEISPVTIRLRNDDKVLASIAAVRAAILLREKRIRFTGQVRVSSGDAELTTEELIFIPEAALLQTDHPFILKRGGNAIHGPALTTDIFLKIGDSH